MRLFFFLIAIISIGLGFWTLTTAALSVSDNGAVPTEAEAARAGWAARLGMVQGDLYATSALLNARLASHNGANQAALAAREDARMALSLAPMRSDIWLLLSALEAGTPAAARSDPLEMVYLVGGGKREELVQRLARASQSPTLKDDILRTFAQTDVSIALSKLPNAHAVLRADYASAPPENRALLLPMVSSVDPAFAKELAAQH